MKVLFLDIDGVLQPLGKQERFEHRDEIPAIAARLNREKQNGFDYEAYVSGYAGLCDVGAVYFDWNKEAVEGLRQVLATTGARIVISSDWRDKGFEVMKAFLAIYDLDGYLEDMTYYLPFSKRHQPEYQQQVKDTSEMYKQLNDQFRALYPSDPNEWFDGFDSRTAEIREYLDYHPEITSFVAVDDRNLAKGLDEHFVHTRSWLTKENVQQCIDILNRNDGPYPLPEGMRTPEVIAWRKNYLSAAKK